MYFTCSSKAVHTSHPKIGSFEEFHLINYRSQVESEVLTSNLLYDIC